MKLAVISDTHTYHRKVDFPQDQNIDILVSCGDESFRGEMDVLQDFVNWMREQPAKHKVMIFGNHSVGMKESRKREPALEMIERAEIIYLENSETIIDGLKIYGSPVSPFFHDWEFQKYRGKNIAAVWDKIPGNTDILITHSPPFGILDEAPRTRYINESIGCEELRRTIDTRLKNLKLHLFGHCHNGSGIVEKNGIVYVNAAICTEEYKPTNPIRIVEI